jgi:S1-C subfamily serine protease
MMAKRLLDRSRAGADARGTSRLTVLSIALCVVQAGAALAAPPPARPAPCRESIVELYRRVSPAVVSITAAVIDPYDTQSRTERRAGSGVIVDSSGLVLTNSHVVSDHPVITVTLDDGATLPAQIVGADPVFDVALLRIAPAGAKLPTARLGSSERLLTGEEVYAIGNPFGLEQTLTRGIVSAVNRILPGASWFLREPLIQTDAAINPGSSGGPLINRCGDVVGITTAILPEAQNIGFAIPVDLVKSVMPDLILKGRVIRPWLGVQGQVVTTALKDLLRAPMTDGFLVEVVEPESPASRLDLRGGDLDVTISGRPFLLGGDIITQIDGAPVNDEQKLGQALGSLKVGASARLTLYREQKTRLVDVAVIERPAPKTDFLARRALAPAADLPARAADPQTSARRAF